MESEVNEVMVQKYLHIPNGNNRLTHKGGYYRQSMLQIFARTPNISMHGDIQRKNIMVRRTSRTHEAMAPQD